MKTCPNCQAANIPDDAQFCPVCGQQILSSEQLKKQRKQERKQLRREAEKAWDAYPNKPCAKKNPYSLLWKVMLFLGIIAGIIIYQYLMHEYGATHMAVPEEVIMIVRLIAYTIIGLLVFFIFLSRSFNPNEEIDKAKEQFISDYMSKNEDQE